MIAKRLAALSVALLAAVPAPAQELTEDQQIEATMFAYGASVFVLRHEIGHLFIHEFGLPVLGREEDAADNLATITMLADPDDDETVQALYDAANGWWLSENASGSETYEEADFYDVHSLDIQRAYQIVCLMVGANPPQYSSTADEYGLDPDRQQSCADDYAAAASSWETVLAPHAGGGGATVTASYEPASEDYQDIEGFLREMRFLEKAAAMLQAGYALPRDITLLAAQCDEENAYYDQDNASITFCYEMFAYFFDLYADDLLKNPGT